MEKVLVTGGCGLIGRHICSGLLKKGYEVIAVDIEESGYNVGKLHYSSVQCEPTDKNTIAELFEKHDFYAVIHAACTVDNDMGPIVTDKQVKDSAAVDKFIYRYAFSGCRCFGRGNGHVVGHELRGTSDDEDRRLPA